MKHFLACFIGLLLLSIHSKAQNDVDKTVYTVDTQIPSYIYMKDSKIGSHLLKTSSKKVDTADFLKRILNLNEETVAVLSDTLTDFNGGFHKFYTEYYKGIKVEGSRYGIHYDKQGVIKSMNGNFRTIDTLNIVPNITETDAIEVALNHVGATEYAWQNKEEEDMLKVARGDFNATYKPTGEILIYFSNNKPFLVYVFNIPSNPQPIGFSGILLAKRQNSFYCTYFLHNRNVADTKSPYPIKRLEVIRWFNQKSMVFNQSLS